MNNVINVYFEIEWFCKVLVHRSYKEVENLMSHFLECLLFHDIPFFKNVKVKHDVFVRSLENNGVKFVY